MVPTNSLGLLKTFGDPSKSYGNEEIKTLRFGGTTLLSPFSVTANSREYQV